MPEVLLGLGVYWSIVAVNAHRPRFRPPVLAVVSFFPAWLLTERLPVRLVGQVVVVGGLAGLGAVSRWPGWLGLGLCAVVVVLQLQARFGKAGGAGAAERHELQTGRLGQGQVPRRHPERRFGRDRADGVAATAKSFDVDKFDAQPFSDPSGAELVVLGSHRHGAAKKEGDLQLSPSFFSSAPAPASASSFA